MRSGPDATALGEEAGVLAVGFRIGLVRQSEIIAWADRTIAVQDSPSTAILELAMMGKSHPLDVLGKLKELFASDDLLAALPSALGRFTERLRREPRLGPIVARGLEELLVEAGYQVPHDLLPMYELHYDYELARRGTLNEADVHAWLLEFCEQFEDGPLRDVRCPR